MLLIPSVVSAQEDAFNPNSLLSDEDLTRYDSMSREDIYSFLKAKGGYISSFATEDKDGFFRTVPDIIYRAAQEHRINPQYLLVKLQKEQSLVTAPSPSQKQIDWASGYGVCDGCSMDDPAIQKHKGFGKQVDSAAGIMRWYFDHLATEPWIKRPSQAYTIDNTPVVPATLATAFLYTYTPHLEGNKNFWTLWKRWFDQIYPDGTLIKLATDPTVYVLQAGKRRPITSMTALITRYDPKLIITVPDSELARYEMGTSISLPNYSILKNGTEYYLLDYDTIRPFADESVIKSFGYNPDEFIDVTSDDIVEYTVGIVITAQTQSPLGRVVRLKENQSLYYLKDGMLNPMYDDQLAKVNFPNLKIEKVAVEDLGTISPGTPVTFKDGTLLGVKGANDVYVIEHGKKRHIMSEEAFIGLGYKGANIVWVNEIMGNAHETGQPLYFDGAFDPNSGQAQLSSH